MGHIHFEPQHGAEGYIPYHFSHAALVNELRVETPYAREGLIVPNTFWEKVEASYLSDPRLMLRQHECSILDYILRHDHLLAYQAAVTSTISPPMTIWQTSGKGPPPTGSGTHEPVAPLQVTGVPEPSSIILVGLAALMISAYVLTRALGRRRQSASIQPLHRRPNGPEFPPLRCA
jgi:hypothetical protein